MDWTRSGRVDNFEFYRIDAAKGIGGAEAKMTGVVGGSLTWNYNSSTKVSGSLEVTKTGIVNNSLVRVYMVSTLNGETVKTELATCYAHTSRGHYENGIYSGTIDLRGTLCRYTDDKLVKNFCMAKKGSALGYFKTLFKWVGGPYSIKNVKDRQLTGAKVVEYGETPMTVMQYIASFLGGEITCDTHGRTVLQPYVAPGKKPVSKALPTGERSLMLPGIDIESTQDGTPNRAAVKYTYKVKQGSKQVDKTIIGVASAATTAAISSTKTGRYISQTYDVNALNPRTQARANQVAAARLKQASGYTRSYSFSMFYYPIQIGQVVELRYGAINVAAIVTKIDMRLKPGAPMSVTCRHVRGL